LRSGVALPSLNQKKLQANNSISGGYISDFYKNNPKATKRPPESQKKSLDAQSNRYISDGGSHSKHGSEHRSNNQSVQYSSIQHQ
jgi:hypothetical protein